MYETKYRTATIMEEDALNKPTAAGAMLSAHQIIFHSNILLFQEENKVSSIFVYFALFV